MPSGYPFIVVSARFFRFTRSKKMMPRESSKGSLSPIITRCNMHEISLIEQQPFVIRAKRGRITLKYIKSIYYNNNIWTQCCEPCVRTGSTPPPGAHQNGMSQPPSCNIPFLFLVIMVQHGLRNATGQGCGVRRGRIPQSRAYVDKISLGIKEYRFG
jgi:hypothetical protein